MDYSYSFSPELEQEWTWTERYATQPEILAVHRAMSRTGSTCDGTSRSTTRVHRGDYDEAARPLDRHHGAGGDRCRPSSS